MTRYLFILFAALLVGCGESRQQLRLLTYPDYLDPEVIKDFERNFDCKVVIDFAEGGSALDAKLKTGGATAYDIVSMGDVAMCAPLGILAELGSETIPNLKNIDPQFDALSFDKGVRYSVPFSWGAVGLYVRRADSASSENSWSAIFDPRKQDGPFYLLNDARTCIGAALRYLGHSVNSKDSNALAAAREILIDAKRRSLGFLDGTAVKNHILGRSGTAAIAWNDTSAQGVREDPETSFFVPREGSCLLLDGFSILRRAPHGELAQKFLNYLLDPRVAAQSANFLHIATPNKAALELVAAGDRNNPAIYPPPEVIRRLELVRDLGEFNKVYDEVWTQIKAK